MNRRGIREAMRKRFECCAFRSDDSSRRKRVLNDRWRQQGDTRIGAWEKRRALKDPKSVALC